MYLNHPVNESWSYSFIDFMLLRHVSWVSIPFVFNTEHVILYRLDKLGYMVDVMKILSINLWNMTEDLVITSLMEHLQLLLKGNLRQFISRRCSICRRCSFALTYTKTTNRCSWISSLTLCWGGYIWMRICS